MFDMRGIEEGSLSYAVETFQSSTPIGSLSQGQQVLAIQFCVKLGMGFVHKGSFPELDVWSTPKKEGSVRHIAYNTGVRSNFHNADKLAQAMHGLKLAAMSGSSQKMWVQFRIPAANGGWEIVPFLKKYGAVSKERMG